MAGAAPPAGAGVLTISNADERYEIQAFWRGLSRQERRALIESEEKSVKRKLHEYQRHACACAICQRKRHAIDTKLSEMYAAYYDAAEAQAAAMPELIDFDAADEAVLPGPFPGSVALDRHGGVVGHNLILARYALRSRRRKRDDLYYDELDEDEYDDEDDYDDDLDDEDKCLQNPDCYCINSTLTIKGILSVADDLSGNEAQKLVLMLEQFSERCTTGDDADEWTDDSSSRSEVELSPSEQREQGWRMFQIFAARVLEHRVLQAYRERVAHERQRQLLRELEEEESTEKAREAKRAKENQRRKDRKRQMRQQKEEERLRKEQEKAAEEEAAREAQRREAERREAQRREAERREAEKREAQRREAEKKAAQRREAEKREAQRREERKKQAEERRLADERRAAEAEERRRRQQERRKKKAEAPQKAAPPPREPTEPPRPAAQPVHATQSVGTDALLDFSPMSFVGSDGWHPRFDQPFVPPSSSLSRLSLQEPQDLLGSWVPPREAAAPPGPIEPPRRAATSHMASAAPSPGVFGSAALGDDEPIEPRGRRAPGSFGAPFAPFYSPWSTAPGYPFGLGSSLASPPSAHASPAASAASGAAPSTIPPSFPPAFEPRVPPTFESTWPSSWDRARHAFEQPMDPLPDFGGVSSLSPPSLPSSSLAAGRARHTMYPYP